ncbi:MAG: homocysteine S-methyltransferase family protein [Pseudomonadota bacterium]
MNFTTKIHRTPFLSDGGLETWMVFHEAIPLRDFAAFELVESAAGREALRTYYRRFARIAQRSGCGFLFESPTWRASPDWGARLGYDPDRLAAVNRGAVEMLATLSSEFPHVPSILSGCVGPRGDGYEAHHRLQAGAAQAYHMPQVAALAMGGAEVISAITMTHIGEAIGIARAATALGLPSVISFTVETDGRLPDGSPLSAAIWAVDAATGHAPAYYMVNCAHPTHFRPAFEAGADWLRRIGGLKANASHLSHAELDCAEVLDDGNPQELAAHYAALRRILPNLRVTSGCCGTDHRHLSAMAQAMAA